MNAPLLKSYYDNIQMTIYFDIINLVQNFMMVNELKSPYEKQPF